MKKIRIRLAGLFILITIIVTLLLARTVSIGGGDSGEWYALWNGGSNVVNGCFRVNDTTAGKYDNIYCIEHGGRLIGNGNDWYYVSAVVTLTGAPGGSGYIHYYSKGQFGFGSEEGLNGNITLNSGMHNRILAAILNSGQESSYDLGMWYGNRSRSKLYAFSTSIISILEYMG